MLCATHGGVHRTSRKELDRDFAGLGWDTAL